MELRDLRTLTPTLKRPDGQLEELIDLIWLDRADTTAPVTERIRQRAVVASLALRTTNEAAKVWQRGAYRCLLGCRCPAALPGRFDVRGWRGRGPSGLLRLS